MYLRKFIALFCAAATVLPLLCGAVQVKAAPDFQKFITIATENTPTGCAAPLAAFDISQAPFHTGGPFTVTGYYKYHSDGVMYKDGMTGGSANVFGTPVSDTAGQWKSFSSSFSTASSLTFKGIDMWYMAGELSLGGLVVRNAAGTVVYDMDQDPALTAVKTTALARKGIWYLYTFSQHPDFLITVTAPESELGLVWGSNYLLSNNALLGIPAGTDVLTVRSNLTRSDRITAWKDSTKLADSAIVTPDTVFVYNKGGADSVTLTVRSMIGDLNGDGKVDIRDLRLTKEIAFGDDLSADQLAADVDSSAAIDGDDVSLLRDTITGQILYTTQTAGVDALLKLANPVGRLHKDNNMLLMEHSASNFTLTGRLQGTVTAEIWAERTSSLSDPMGLFIEVDGKMRYESVLTPSQHFTVTLAKNLAPGKHTIRVYKASDAANDVISISAVRYTGQLSQTPSANRRIEFLGDSITAGADVFSLNSVQRQKYGALTSYYSYAKYTADALNAAHYSVANSGWRLGYTVNPQYTIRSVYPYQSMRSGYEGGQYDFDWNPQVVVINLGTNDRFTSSEANYKEDVRQLLQLVRQKNPGAAIFWAYGAMDLSHASNQWIKSAVESFAATDGNTYFVTLPQNTYGANQHPDQSGQEALASTLTRAIKDVMGW